MTFHRDAIDLLVPVRHGAIRRVVHVSPLREGALALRDARDHLDLADHILAHVGHAEQRHERANILRLLRHLDPHAPDIGKADINFLRHAAARKLAARAASMGSP